MSRLHLFDAIGVELEYMIVDAQTLDVKPVADELIKSVAGEYVSDVEAGELAWSNELVAHVIELKTNGPSREPATLSEPFHAEVRRINKLLVPLGARLMPTAMHPWMDPATETELWKHEYSEVYEAFNRVFECRGHGWSNLQSTHLNLPFADDEEFGRLHAAVRLVLPLLPALAASSPIVDGKPTGTLDTRLDMYRTNSARIPSVSGLVIPEQVFTFADYKRVIFDKLNEDIAPHDPDHLMRDEFLNARGAIARFERGSIEIRVLDIQECPACDIALTTLILDAVRALVGQRWTNTREQQSFSEVALAPVFLATLRDADTAVITDAKYLAQFGWTDARKPTAGELWIHLAEQLGTESPLLRRLLDAGPLARRILTATGPRPTREKLRDVFAALCECLATNTPFGVR